MSCHMTGICMVYDIYMTLCQIWDIPYIYLTYDSEIWIIYTKHILDI